MTSEVDGNPSDLTQVDDVEPSEILSKAESFRAQGKVDDALFHYASYLEHDPQNAKVLKTIGDIHSKKGNLDLAQAALELSIESDPDSVSILESLGLVLLQRGDFTRAKPLLQKAISQEPELWRSHNALGLIDDRHGHHETATEHFRKALTLAPRNERVANNLAYSLYLKGEVSAALAETDQILSRNARYEPAIMNRGLYLLKLGRAEEAFDAFRRVVSVPDAWNNLGYFSMQMGDYERARRCFEKAISLDSHYHEMAHRNLEQLDRIETDSDRQQVVMSTSMTH